MLKANINPKEVRTLIAGAKLRRQNASTNSAFTPTRLTFITNADIKVTDDAVADATAAGVLVDQATTDFRWDQDGPLMRVRQSTPLNDQEIIAKLSGLYNGVPVMHVPPPPAVPINMRGARVPAV